MIDLSRLALWSWILVITIGYLIQFKNLVPLIFKLVGQ